MKIGKPWIVGMMVVSGSTMAWAADPADVARAERAELLMQDSARASSAPSGGTFNIADGSGNYNLNVSGWTQFRYVMNWRDDPSDTASAHDSGFTNGFEVTRTRLIFSGNVINPDFKFKIESEFDRATGNLGLKDAWGSYKFNNGLSVKWGQFKPPLLREDLMSDTKQLAVDRSVMHGVFQQNRSQGVELGYRGDAFGFQFDFNDGLKAINTPYTSPAESDYGLTARVEGKWAGDWKAFDDFTSFRNSPYAGMVGVAAHYQHMGDTASLSASNVPVAVTQQGLFEYTVDASVEGNGWNVYAAFVGRHIEPDQGDSLDDFGFLVQGGFFVTDQLEPFARYDGVFPDSDRSSGDDDFNTLTFGINYYVLPESHAAKFTADVQWFFDNTTGNALVGPVANGGVQALQTSGEDNQVAVRFQFQLMF